MKKDEKFPIEASNLFKLREIEIVEINRMKWLESEKVGYDIGWDRAQFIWLMNHRHKWLISINSSGIYY